MKKQKSHLLLVLGIVAILGLFVRGAFRMQSDKSRKVQKVADLVATMEDNPNKDSQAYKEAQRKFCLLTARPAKEREQAVSNIRKFLGMVDIPVEFLCSRFNNDSGTDYISPVSEHYEAGGFDFIVDPDSNYIVGVDQTEVRWGYNKDGSRWSDPQPEYDNTPRYTTPEAIRPVAERFIRDHQDILGVDISKMDYKLEGSKLGNFFVRWIDYEISHTEEYEQCGDVDRALETAYQRGDGVWCAKIENTHYPAVSLTITQGGQVIVYSNDGWEMEKL